LCSGAVAFRAVFTPEARVALTHTLHTTTLQCGLRAVGRTECLFAETAFVAATTIGVTLRADTLATGVTLALVEAVVLTCADSTVITFPARTALTFTFHAVT